MIVCFIILFNPSMVLMCWISLSPSVVHIILCIQNQSRGELQVFNSVVAANSELRTHQLLEFNWSHLIKTLEVEFNISRSDEVGSYLPFTLCLL